MYLPKPRPKPVTFYYVLENTKGVPKQKYDIIVFRFVFGANSAEMVKKLIF